MKLWLDDVRPAPEGWEWARSVNAAKELMLEHECSEASLDHDMGYFAADGGDGWRLIDWIAENDLWPLERVTVHSGNPVGRERILGVVERYGPYGK